jgi:outer membrane lipoprotein carrier protein
MAFNCLIPLLFSAFVQAQGAASPEAAVLQLQSLLDQTQTLSAEVQQLLLDQDGRELQENQVLLLMQKPASFYWGITEPYEDLLVTDGDIIWHYEPDLGQVTIQPFDDDVNRTPVMLLNGDAASIAEAYEVSVASVGDTQLQRFILIPRKPGSLFERLSLSFNGPVLEEMQFEDSLGQQTSLSFRDVQRNLPLDDTRFTFTPPAGVDIIDNTGE